MTREQGWSSTTPLATTHLEGSLLYCKMRATLAESSCQTRKEAGVSPCAGTWLPVRSSREPSPAALIPRKVLRLPVPTESLHPQDGGASLRGERVGQGSLGEGQEGGVQPSPDLQAPHPQCPSLLHALLGPEALPHQCPPYLPKISPALPVALSEEGSPLCSVTPLVPFRVISAAGYKAQITLLQTTGFTGSPNKKCRAGSTSKGL